MRKIICVVLCLGLTGCSSVRIPSYLQDKNSKIKRIHANFDQALAATKQALGELGWEIEETTDPLVYEQDRIHDLDEQKVLLITKVRQTSLIIGTRYAKMNIYIRSKKNISEIEIRYLTINSLPLKNFQNYRNDSAVERIFTQINRFLYPDA
jgi:hypothetical protein